MAVAVTPEQSSEPSAVKPSDEKKDPLKLIYPLNLSEIQDCISFQVLELNPKTSPGTSVSNTGQGDIENINSFVSEKTAESYQKVKGTPTVYLPIQSGITDTNTVSWGSGTLNAVEREFVNLSLGLMTAKNPGELVVGELQKAYAQLQGEGGDAARIYLAQLATGTQGLLPRITGQVLNPNLELLFRGPELRPFQFQFQLSPRGKTEADEVKKIIRFFKEHMAVRRSNSSLFLKAPYVFRIRYLNGLSNEAAAHPSIGLIKECALKSFNVDYTPLGSYATYDDFEKTMVSYKISMDFQEIVPIYDADYDTKNADDVDIKNSSIGY